MVRNGMVLQKLQHFVTWLVGISIDFYYKELIENGAKPAFSIWHQAYYVSDIAWQVNSRRSIFRIVDPIIIT